jgi:UDP-N-acetylglucosamine transferase subunit ALG13
MGAPLHAEWSALCRSGAVILVTVGTQLPFDRLIQIMDRLAPSLALPVFAQTGPGTYRPRNIEWEPIVYPAAFEDMMARASVIIAHAGIGTVIGAKKWNKPIVLFPRKAQFGEHRNDHQLATAMRLEGRSGIYVAYEEEEIAALLKTDLQPPCAAEHTERRRLLDYLENYLACL